MSYRSYEEKSYEWQQGILRGRIKTREIFAAEAETDDERSHHLNAANDLMKELGGD